MRQVYIVRHGNTFDPGDIVRRVGQGTDLPLSKSGHVQAEALGAHFRTTQFEKIVSSPLLRTRQTAEAITDKRVSFDDRLLEIDYGPDEGQPETAVIARLGAEAIPRWDAESVPPEGWHVDPDRLRADWVDLLNESVGTTLIVTSNGIARFALDVCRPGDFERKLRTGAYGLIEETKDGWQIVCWNRRP